MFGSLAMAKNLAEALVAEQFSGDVDVVVCPPFPYITTVANAVQGSTVGLGAQNVYPESEGAYTGEVAPAMLKDCGCSHVIVGHSERRALFAETNEMVGRKVIAALNAGLTPILCVGETAEQRKRDETFKVIDAMIQAVNAQLGGRNWSDLIVAYEPVWAIGTGLTASPEQAQEVHRHIRDLIRSERLDEADAVRILYGGSVKPGNAKDLFGQPDIDGGLIGGASLKADDFAAICHAAVKV